VHKNAAVVALANKLARIAWAVLSIAPAWNRQRVNARYRTGAVRRLFEASFDCGSRQYARAD
jgi:hypothetical protein